MPHTTKRHSVPQTITDMFSNIGVQVSREFSRGGVTIRTKNKETDHDCFVADHHALKNGSLEGAVHAGGGQNSEKAATSLLSHFQNPAAGTTPVLVVPYSFDEAQDENPVTHGAVYGYHEPSNKAEHFTLIATIAEGVYSPA